MNFEDVQLDNIQSIGQYIMDRNNNLGLFFYGFDNNEDDTIRQIMTAAALRVMAYYMDKDLESEKQNVEDLFDILQAFPDDENKLEDFEAASDTYQQHVDELNSVQDALVEIRSNIEIV